MIDPAVLVVALSPAMTGAVLGWFIRQQRNGRNGRPKDPEADPYGTRIGDVPVAWWVEQQRKTLDEFKLMRKAVEAHMESHHA